MPAFSSTAHRRGIRARDQRMSPQVVQRNRCPDSDSEYMDITTNNEAEYCGLVLELHRALVAGITVIAMREHSRLQTDRPPLPVQPAATLSS
jgi:hypothetical protein